VERERKGVNREGEGGNVEDMEYLGKLSRKLNGS